MRESIFHGEWRDSWRFHHPGCHIIKVPDMPRSAEARFNPVKPYDFYAMHAGRFYAMELKMRTNTGGFPFKDVSESQLNNLQEARENGARSLIVINYRIQKISEKQVKVHPYLEPGRLNIVFVVEIDLFRDLDRQTYSKSIPLATLFEPFAAHGVIKNKKDGEFWDIPTLTGGLK